MAKFLLQEAKNYELCWETTKYSHFCSCWKIKHKLSNLWVQILSTAHECKRCSIMARYYFCQWCLTYLCCPIYRNIRSGELKREYKKLAASTFLFHLLLKSDSAAAAASSKADLLLSLAFQSNIRCW